MNIKVIRNLITMSQSLKIVLAIIITATVVGGGFYFWQQQKDQQPILNTDNSLPTENVENSSIITIMVPENYTLYKQEMTEFAQIGGIDPLNNIKFEKKIIKIPLTTDLIKASAQAAAEEIAPSGGPAKASIAYLKVQNKTAYVLLDIDLDGWAGVSASLAIIHPLVEKTLLQFPEINKVVFGYAPGDR